MKSAIDLIIPFSQLAGWFWVSLGAVSSGCWWLFQKLKEERDEIISKLASFSKELSQFSKELTMANADFRRVEEVLNVKIENLSNKIEHYEKNNQLATKAVLDEVSKISRMLESEK